MAADPTATTAERSAPSEGEPLPGPASGAQVPAGIHAGGATGAAPRIAAYDFRNPAFLSDADLRRLRLAHEDFVRYLSGRLSLHLRLEFGLKMTRLETITYASFCASLPQPTHLALFKVEPLVGVGILDLNPRLALTIADRLLGGRGHSVQAGRHLTEIEIALIEDVVLVLLEEWCAQWKAEQALRPLVIGHDNNGRFLQTSPKDAIVLALTLECTFGDCCEPIQIGVPYYTIEPLVKKMQARRQKDTAIPTAVRPAEWQAAYDRIAVPVRAEWQALELSVREIACLRVGDVIELPAALCQETCVLIGGAPKFIGTVGLDTDRVAIQLTRKAAPEESSHAKPDGRKVP